MSEDELLDRYFLRNGKWEEQQRHLIQALKEEIKDAKKRMKSGGSSYFKKALKKGMYQTNFFFKALFFIHFTKLPTFQDI
ncbi:hypothetical protein MUB16_20490 [Priestia sp. OVL9]|nr:hypothetical protein [Priestia sp. OVL9]